MEITRWVGILLITIILILGGRWINMAAKADTKKQQMAKQSALAAKNHVAPPTESERREYVLEVIGLGATFEKYRQMPLWDALQKGSPYTSIREQNPKKYPWSRGDKGGRGGSRSFDALENGANFTPMYWGVPSFYAGPPMENPNDQTGPNDPMAGLVAGAETNGMPWHLFAVGPWKLAERPDTILEDVFAFFDAHPDVPYIVLTADDSMVRREANSDPRAAFLLKDGYYIPERPDAAVTIVLAKRERVEPLRAYVWNDPDNDFGQNKTRMMYYDLMQSVPSPEKLRNPKVFSQRLPTVAEWLPAAAAFAQLPDTRGVGLEIIDNYNPWKTRPPRNWKPTPWFPIPWSEQQMETFDRLPSFGFIHRPTFVKFRDEQGRPVTRRDARQKILDAGWQQALSTLPESVRTTGPARMIAATDGDREQLLILHGLLQQYAAQGGPEIDTGKSDQFIDTDKRLGNTGAATFFMQMAIGVMGSYRAGGVSAAINLRDPDEASIIFITPPPAAVRQRQDASNDIFRSRIVPAIDPGNYAAPSVEAMVEAKENK